MVPASWHAVRDTLGLLCSPGIGGVESELGGEAPEGGEGFDVAIPLARQGFPGGQGPVRAPTLAASGRGERGRTEGGKLHRAKKHRDIEVEPWVTCTPHRRVLYPP